MTIWPRRSTISDQRLIEAAEILARTLDLSQDHQIAALRAAAFGEGEAHRLVALLPIAFSRPVLEDLGVRIFVTEMTAAEAGGATVKADLMRQPEYVAALRVARKHRRKAVMDHDVYKRIAASSAEIDAASNALNDGGDIRGATIASSLTGEAVARHLIR